MWPKTHALLRKMVKALKYRDDFFLKAATAELRLSFV